MSSATSLPAAATGRSVTNLFVRKYMCDCQQYCRRLRAIKKSTFYTHAPFRTTPDDQLIVIVERQTAAPVIGCKSTAASVSVSSPSDDTSTNPTWTYPAH